jgi:hypothetical protein
LYIVVFIFLDSRGDNKNSELNGSKHSPFNSLLISSGMKFQFVSIILTYLDFWPSYICYDSVLHPVDKASVYE